MVLHEESDIFIHATCIKYNVLIYFNIQFCLSILTEQLSTSVHYSDNSINLLCQVRGQWSTYYEKGVNYCLFTRPDNLTFSITSGIGNEK